MYGGLPIGWGALGWVAMGEPPAEVPTVPGYVAVSTGPAASARAVTGRAYSAQTGDTS